MSNHYFNKDTDKALEKFIFSNDSKEKHQLFEDHIRPAFEKLIENLIYVYGFFDLGDPKTLQMEALSNLYEMIPKFDPSKGTKGFSYFNVVAKNWFIHKTREKNKRASLENEIYIDVDHESIANDPNFIIEPHEEKIEQKEKWEKFYSAMDEWRGKLTKESEKKVLDHVHFIMKNADLVHIFNKKAINIYLRDLTGLTSKQIAVNLKKIRMLYAEWLKKYNDTGGDDLDEERDTDRGDSEEFSI